MAKTLEFFRLMFSFRFLENLSEGASIALSYFFIMGGASKPFIDLSNIEGWISLGMFIIIWYGVMKIILNLVWALLFGKKIKFEIGILEFFHNKLKPVQAQRIVDSDEKEFEENIIKKERRLKKVKHSLHTRKDNWRCYHMQKVKNILAKINANKYTILGSIAAVSSVGVGAYEVVGVGPAAISSMGIIDALTAGGFLGAGALALKGVFGKGVENTENFQERKKLEKDNKAATKSFNIEIETQKFQKNLGISQERALELAKDKKAQLKKEAEQKEAKAFKKKTKKVAKKNGISEEKAKKLLSSENSVKKA